MLRNLVFLTFGVPIEIYRRRRVEFIDGGGVPAAAPTSAGWPFRKILKVDCKVIYHALRYIGKWQTRV